MRITECSKKVYGKSYRLNKFSPKERGQDCIRFAPGYYLSRELSGAYSGTGHAFGVLSELRADQSRRVCERLANNTRTISEEKSLYYLCKFSLRLED